MLDQHLIETRSLKHFDSGSSHSSVLPLFQSTLWICFVCLASLTLSPFFSSQVADTYTMPTSDGPSHFPVFVAPPHGNHQRSPGYVPGRVAPVRSPPPAKAPPPLPLKPCGVLPEQLATSNLSEENQRRERAQSLQQRKNTLICFGVSMGALFLTLILILSLTSGDVLDGQYCKLVIQVILIFFSMCIYNVFA